MTTHDPNAFDPLILTALAIPADRLRAICRQLAPAFQRRNTIPVLSTVLIEAGRGGTKFRLTDLDLQITVTADDLTCAAPFRACVPFALLRRVAATFEGVIRITHTLAKLGGQASDNHPDRLTLATEDGTSATINLVCPPEDFPEWHDSEGDFTCADATPAALLRLLTLAAPMVSTEETRYYLSGVYLCRKPDGETLRAVATDGHRMAVIDSGISIEGANAILPIGLVRAIRAALDAKGNAPVTLALAPVRARILAGPVRIDAKLIDGTFPNYLKIIGAAPPRMRITLNRTALNRLLPFATTRSNRAKFSGGHASVRSYFPEGEISVPVTMKPIEGPEGALIDCGYSLGYLIDQARLTPTFRMDVTSATDPARIQGEDPDALWVIMPMRV